MIVCMCKGVEEKNILAFLRKHPSATISDLKSHTSVSTVCGRCLPVLKEIMEEQQSRTQQSNQLKIQF